MITVIIQGTFHENCLDVLDEYKKYGPVIISCYSNDDTSKVPSDVTLIKSPLPEIQWYNVNNIYYQSFSSYRALSLVETPLVLKTRCNEKYSDVSKIINKIKENPQKMITCNVAFPRCSIQALHPSDHMIACCTAILRAIFYDVMALCKKLPVMDTNIYGKELGVEWIGHLLPEQIICLTFLKYRGIDLFNWPVPPTTDYLRQIMNKFIDVIPVEDLGDVTHSIFADGERRFRKGGEGLYGYLHESIRNIEEV